MPAKITFLLPMPVVICCPASPADTTVHIMDGLVRVGLAALDAGTCTRNVYMSLIIHLAAFSAYTAVPVVRRGCGRFRDGVITVEFFPMLSALFADTAIPVILQGRW